jgi:hypothetical protein
MTLGAGISSKLTLRNFKLGLELKEITRENLNMIEILFEPRPQMEFLWNIEH